MLSRSGHSAAIVTVLSAMAITSIAGSGCSDRNKATDPPPPVAIELTPEARIVDGERIQLELDNSDLDKGLLYLTGDQAHQVSIGSILVGSEAGGYLVKVTGTDPDSSGVRATTEGAKLVELVETGTFDIDVDPEDPGIRSGTRVSTIPGATLVPGGIRLEDAEFEFGAEASLTLTGTVGYDVELSPLHFEIEDRTLIAADVVGSLSINASVSVIASTSGSFTATRTANVVSVTRPFVNLVPIPVFPFVFPIVGTFETGVDAHAIFNIEGEITIESGHQASYSADVGGRFEAGSWTEVQAIHLSGEPIGTPDIATAQGDLTIELVPYARIVFYRAIGPSLEGVGYASAGIDVSTSGWTSDLVVGGKARAALDLQKIDDTVPLLERTWQLPEQTLWRAPARVLAVSDTLVAGLAGQPVQGDVQVRVLDSSGQGVVGALVHFETGNASGTTSEREVETDDKGSASTEWTLAPKWEAKTQTLSAYVLCADGQHIGDSPVEFEASPADITVEVVSGDRQTTSPGSQVPDPLVVLATDSDGEPREGVRVEFWAGEDTLRVETDSDGIARAGWILGVDLGDYELTAGVPGLLDSEFTFQGRCKWPFHGIWTGTELEIRNGQHALADLEVEMEQYGPDAVRGIRYHPSHYEDTPGFPDGTLVCVVMDSSRVSFENRHYFSDGNWDFKECGRFDVRGVVIEGTGVYSTTPPGQGCAGNYGGTGPLSMDLEYDWERNEASELRNGSKPVTWEGP